MNSDHAKHNLKENVGGELALRDIKGAGDTFPTHLSRRGQGRSEFLKRLERVARIELATFSLGSSKGGRQINALAPNRALFGPFVFNGL